MNENEQTQELPQGIQLDQAETMDLINELGTELDQANADRRLLRVKLRGLQATVNQLNAAMAAAAETIKAKDAEIEQLKSATGTVTQPPEETPA